MQLHHPSRPPPPSPAGATFSLPTPPPDFCPESASVAHDTRAENMRRALSHNQNIAPADPPPTTQPLHLRAGRTPFRHAPCARMPRTHFLPAASPPTFLALAICYFFGGAHRCRLWPPRAARACSTRARSMRRVPDAGKDVSGVCRPLWQAGSTPSPVDALLCPNSIRANQYG